MSEFDETADLIEWLRQPRWMEGEKQRRLFEAADEIEKLRHALKVLLEEATSFSVSGVYFDEDSMGHKGPELARKALYP